MVPAGGNGNRHRPRGSRAPPRPHRGPTGCYRRRKTGRPRITSPWTCAPHRTGNPRVFELHSPLSAEEFRSLRSKRCSAYARRQTATGQTTGRMRTPKHGGRRRRRAKAGRATTRHDGGPGANPALHKVPNMSPASWRRTSTSTSPTTGCRDLRRATRLSHPVRLRLRHDGNQGPPQPTHPTWRPSSGT